MCTFFILLGRGATGTNRAYKFIVFIDGYRALGGQHAPSQSRDDGLDDRRICSQGATGPPKSRRGGRLALRHGGANRNRALHAIKGHQVSTGITHRHAQLDVDRFRLGNCGLNHAIGLIEGQ